MRLLNLVSAAAISLAPMATAEGKEDSSDSVDIQKDIPEQCQRTSALVAHEADKFGDWVTENVCPTGRQDRIPGSGPPYGVSSLGQKKGLVPYFLRALRDLPMSERKASEKRIERLYQRIMTKCVKIDRVITKHPNLCNLND